MFQFVSVAYHPTIVQLQEESDSIFCVLSDQIAVDSSKNSCKCFVFEAEQAHFSLPLLSHHVLQPPSHLGGNQPDSLQYFNK